MYEYDYVDKGKPYGENPQNRENPTGKTLAHFTGIGPKNLKSAVSESAKGLSPLYSMLNNLNRVGTPGVEPDPRHMWLMLGAWTQMYEGIGGRGKPLPGLEGGVSFLLNLSSHCYVLFKFLFVVVYVIHIKGLSFLRRLTTKF